jgi:hypothetical protein
MWWFEKENPKLGKNTLEIFFKQPETFLKTLSFLFSLLKLAFR